MKNLLIITTLLIALSLTSQFVVETNDKNRRELENAREVKERSCEDIGKKLYDIDSDQKNYGKEYRTSIRKSFRPENRLEILITNPDSFDFKEESMKLIPTIAVYVVFAILSLLGFFLYCLSTCCSNSIYSLCCKCCTNKKSGKCMGIQCVQKQEFKGIRLLVPLICMFVSFFYIAICAIVGLANTSGIEDGFQSMHCSIVDTLYALNYGVENKEGKSWMGIIGFSEKLGDLAEEIGGTYKDSVETSFKQNTDWIVDSKQEMDVQLEIMRTEYGSKLVKVSDKYQYSTDPENGVSNINSCFFNESEVCNTRNNKVQTTKWKIIVEVLQQIITETIDANSEAAKSVQQQGDIILKEIDNGMVTTIEKGKKDIDDIKTQLDDQISDMDKKLGDIGKIIKDLVTPNLQITFSIFLAISIILGIVGALIAVMKIYKLRFVLHLCWVFFSLLAFFLFISTTVFLSVSVAGTELCDFMDRALNDIATFNDIDQLQDDIKEKLSICKNELYVQGSKFQKGDILGTFGVRDSLEEINSLEEKIAGFDKTQNETNKGFEEITTQLATSLVYLQQLIDGSEVDDTLEVNSLLAAFTAVQDAVGQCTNANVQDTLLLKSDDVCITAAIVTDYKYWNTDGSQKDLSLGSGDLQQQTNSCVWLNGDHQDSESSQVGGVTYAQLNNRYTTDCTFAANELQKLMDWIADKNEVGLLKKDQTQTFLNQFETYKNSNQAYLASIVTFQDATKDLTTGITASDGILGDDVTNCLFVGQKLDLINDAMCVIFFPNVYTFTKILAAFSFGLFFSSLFLWIMASRFSKNAILSAQNKQIKIENENQNYKTKGGEIAMEA